MLTPLFFEWQNIVASHFVLLFEPAGNPSTKEGKNVKKIVDFDFSYCVMTYITSLGPRTYLAIGEPGENSNL